MNKTVPNKSGHPDPISVHMWPKIMTFSALKRILQLNLNCLLWILISLLGNARTCPQKTSMANPFWPHLRDYGHTTTMCSKTKKGHWKQAFTWICIMDTNMFLQACVYFHLWTQGERMTRTESSSRCLNVRRRAKTVIVKMVKPSCILERIQLLGLQKCLMISCWITSCLHYMSM